MRLILVHGRSQEGKDPRKLMEEWLEPLKDGMRRQGLTFPKDTDVSFAFYGDRLGTFTSVGVPVTAGIGTKGGKGKREPIDFLDCGTAIAEDVRKHFGVTDAEVEAEYPGDVRKKAPLDKEWMQAIMRVLDKKFPPMRLALQLFVHDVYLYSKRSGIQVAIDGIVSNALTEEPTVVVSHSLGTVVTYNVIRRDPRKLHIPLYVTLGSPLAVRWLRDQLVPLNYPSCVRTWLNVYDDRDFVALYPLDFEHFPVQPSVTNAVIKNIGTGPHSIEGYLNDPVVSRRIYEELVKEKT